MNADGTLQIAENFVWGSFNDVVANLLGGSINSVGSVTSGLDSNASNFVSFQSADSTFTAAFGGEFANLAAVTAALGDSFKDTTGYGLTAVDNGTTFTVSVIPEPSTTALLGLGGLALILRRRK